METPSEIYDKIYQEAQGILVKYNPCQIKVKDGFVSCAVKRRGIWGFYYNDNNQLCCVGCKYHGSEGCTVECLRCALYLCPNVHSTYTINCINELGALYIKAIEVINIGEIRSPKPEDCGRLK